MTPFFALNQRHPLLPLDLHHRQRAFDTNSSALTRLEHLNIHDFLIHRAIAQAQVRQKKYYDAKHRHVTYKPGDLVLISTAHLTLPLDSFEHTKKFRDKWVGPFKVLKGIDPHTHDGETTYSAYRLDLAGSLSRVHPVFHVSKLKLYTPKPGFQENPPPIFQDHESDYYEISRIIGHRYRTLRGKQTKYLVVHVLWVGYDVGQWIPATYLSSPQPLQEYCDSKKIPLLPLNIPATGSTK